MPNSYIVVPNVITGPLTVTGDLITIGVAAPFTRIGKRGAAGYFQSFNLQSDFVTRDDPAQAAWALDQNAILRGIRQSRFSSGGGQRQQFIAELLGRSGTSTTVTGSTLETTAKRIIVAANTLGPTGSVLVLAYIRNTVQGATATNYRLKFGGTTLHTFGTATPQNHWISWFISNNNATGAQQSAALDFESVSGLVTSYSVGAIDTTLDQNLDLTIQGGASTDSSVVHFFQATDFAGSETGGFDMAIG